MGHQIIQQPDGKFCIFSTYIDQFVVQDKTASEIVEICVDYAADRERERVERIVNELSKGSKNPNFCSRTSYAEAFELHEQHSKNS